MSYVVLARRYRPQKFSELVGQEHVTETLKNAILQKRTAHAYLFTGPRGVGKTSAARILAKALRCLEPAADGEPCNKCLACVEAQDGSGMDVIEIDAASNTGVDNIRNLRENVEYMASVGKVRVYIIDEVHMLSTAAFNALLKTLEEPPPHVVFIFATTELHKVLPTIQSRCQRFDFKRIPPLVMAQKIREICKAEGVLIDEASIKTLVVESEGCQRDAESLLDQAIALCGNEIKVEVLEKSLSLLDRASFMALLRAIGDHNAAEVLRLCGEMNEKGVDAKVLLSRTVDFISDLHYLVFAKSHRGIDDDMNLVATELAKKLSSDEIVRALDLGIKTQAKLYSAINTMQTLESFLVKLCLSRPISAPQVRQGATHSSQPALQQPSGASPSYSASLASARATHPSHASQPHSSQVQSSSRGERVAPVALSSAASHVSDVSGHNPVATLEQYIQQQKPSWTAVLQSVLTIQFENDGVFVNAKADFAGRRLASKDGLDVLKLAYKVGNARVELDQGALPASKQIDPREKIRQKQTAAKEHEAVKAAMKIFDATIRETKVLDDEPQPTNTLNKNNKGADV